MQADRLPALPGRVEQRGRGLDQRRLERVEHGLDVGELEVARVGIGADEARGAGHGSARLIRFASSQLGPTPMSTTSGTCELHDLLHVLADERLHRARAPRAAPRRRARRAPGAASGSAASARRCAAWMRIMASLIRSAAEPWSGRVLRVALAVGAHVEVPVLDLGDVAAALEEGLHVALLPGELRHAVEKGAHPGEALEVARDEGLRVLLRDAELAAQRERALPVDGGEVDRLGAGAHLGRHLGRAAR